MVAVLLIGVGIVVAFDLQAADLRLVGDLPTSAAARTAGAVAIAGAVATSGGFTRGVFVAHDAR